MRVRYSVASARGFSYQRRGGGTAASGMSGLDEVHEGIGLLTWWGFSPAVDLLSSSSVGVAAAAATADAEVNPSSAVDGAAEVNVLLMGAGDCRHMVSDGTTSITL